MEDVQLEFVNSFSQAERMMAWLGERRPQPFLAFDTETSGLKPWRDKLRLVQIGDGKTGWTIPFTGESSWCGLVQEVFKRWDGDWAGHHVKFDENFLLLHAGIKLPRAPHDTMLMSRLADSQASAALKNMSDRWIHPDSSQGQRALTAAMDMNHWEWGTVPLEYPVYWGYAALDTVLTARGTELLLPRVPQEAYEIERACSRVLGRMERTGMRIDRHYTETVGDRLAYLVEQETAAVIREYGVKPGSNDAVAAKLIEDGVELVETTETGKWRLDKEVLLELQHPLAEKVLLIRAARKIVSTYFINLQTDLDENDRVHASINQVAARTGRMSVNDPALQTLPRGTVVRDCFIPAEGNVLLSIDYDQIEMRLLAHFCRDPALIDAINTGDLHTATARRVYGDPTIGKKDHRRQTAKNAAFAKVYCAGVAQFSRTAGVDIEIGRALLNEYDVTFPGVPAFERAVAHTVESRVRNEGRGYVVTPTGRVLFTDSKRSYTGVNYLIQGHAGEIFKRQLVALDAAGFGDYLLCPVHDEAIFEVPMQYAEEALHEAEQVMTDAVRYVVPITATGEILQRWGDKYRDGSLLTALPTGQQYALPPPTLALPVGAS